jgi:hypothetical protein
MNSQSFFYPQKMGRIILMGMEEIMGTSGVDAVLGLSPIEDFSQANKDRSISFEAVSLLQGALEQAYGPHGGRGLALRIGRACFKYGLQEYGSILG